MERIRDGHTITPSCWNEWPFGQSLVGRNIISSPVQPGVVWPTLSRMCQGKPTFLSRYGRHPSSDDIHSPLSKNGIWPIRINEPDRIPCYPSRMYVSVFDDTESEEDMEWDAVAPPPGPVTTTGGWFIRHRRMGIVIHQNHGREIDGTQCMWRILVIVRPIQKWDRILCLVRNQSSLGTNLIDGSPSGKNACIFSVGTYLGEIFLNPVTPTQNHHVGGYMGGTHKELCRDINGIILQQQRVLMLMILQHRIKGFGNKWKNWDSNMPPPALEVLYPKVLHPRWSIDPRIRIGMDPLTVGDTIKWGDTQLLTMYWSGERLYDVLWRTKNVNWVVGKNLPWRRWDRCQGWTCSRYH